MFRMTNIDDRIIRNLDQSPRGMSVSELSSQLQTDRRTIAKYLEVLQAKGILEFEKVGTLKLWSISKSPLISLLVREDDQGKVVKSILNNLEDGISIDRKSTRLNSSHSQQSRMPSSA